MDVNEKPRTKSGTGNGTRSGTGSGPGSGTGSGTGVPPVRSEAVTVSGPNDPVRLSRRTVEIEGCRKLNLYEEEVEVEGDVR